MAAWENVRVPRLFSFAGESGYFYPVSKAHHAFALAMEGASAKVHNTLVIMRVALGLRLDQVSLFPMIHYETYYPNLRPLLPSGLQIWWAGPDDCEHGWASRRLAELQDRYG